MIRDKLSWVICFLSVSIAFSGALWTIVKMLATHNLWYLAWMAMMLLLGGAAEMNRDTDMLVRFIKKEAPPLGLAPLRRHGKLIANIIPEGRAKCKQQ